MNNTLKITLVAMFAITVVVLIGTLTLPFAGVIAAIPAGVGVLLYGRKVLGKDKGFQVE
jgi:hypothetical protein